MVTFRIGASALAFSVPKFEIGETLHYWLDIRYDWHGQLKLLHHCLVFPPHSWVIEMDKEKTKNTNQEGISTKSAFFETVQEQKKKLSGAQRRKLRKEQNRSERMLLREMRLSEKRTVAALGRVLGEAEVSTVDWVERPRGRRYSVFIPGPIEDLKSVKERIGRQNPGLNVDLWYLRTNIRENGGQNLKFTIDMKSFLTLRAMGFEAYYGLKKVTFRKLNNPKPWRKH
ncbi:hypothetical protein JTB14_009415 [Gonioctena quinquepunctata]|nr:hypothetical protein JTB14_009415 [Gonioctena quinquepunctata]